MSRNHSSASTDYLRIQVMSDLHLELNPDFQAKVAPDTDVLILAGDIGSYQAGSRLPAKARRDFGMEQFRARSRGGLWPEVLFVPGNHEYDAGDFDAIGQELRELTESLGIRWLERQSVIIRGVRFLGTTLWTDFDALAYRQEEAVSESDRLQLRSEAMAAGGRFLVRSATNRYGQPMLADEVRSQALVCQRWLAGALAETFAGPTVVVTHFAPSLKSADPRYGRAATTASFCSSLDHFLERSDIWIHGHVHCPLDYTVTAPYSITGACRVVCNPFGLAYKDEQRNFRPEFTISIPVKESIEDAEQRGR